MSHTKKGVDSALKKVQCPPFPPSATHDVSCICANQTPTWSWQISSVKKDGVAEASPWNYLTIDHPDNTSSSATLKATFPSCGKWIVGVKATFNWKPLSCTGGCSETSAEKLTPEATVVGVDRIIVQGSSPEDTGPAGVCVGESITLEAKPCPDSASFPAGEPVWTLTSKPAASTLSNSLGTGTTKAITPDVLGTYVVKAECGSSSDTITINTYIVDLDIFNGQGGSLIAEADEESKGAFTVANLNDTDGDGIADTSDTNVTATTNGRDERDLMKLVLSKPNPDNGGTIKLTIVSGDVKIWEDFKKITEVTNLVFNTSDLPKTLWAEVRAQSSSLRDVELELDYNGCKDTVKATGIWVERTKFTNTGTALSSKATGVITTTFTAFGGKLGLQTHPTDSQTRNGMEMEFTVHPAGIGSETGMFFDVSRQVEGESWQVVMGVSSTIGSVSRTFPTKVEEPNDDNGNTDEDNTPDLNLIYSIDLPGLSSTAAFADRFMMRYNFKEFVRVKVNGVAFTTPGNGVVQGSRCSGYLPWRTNMDVVKNTMTGQWNRNVPGDNEIVEGHEAVGTGP